jgi:hypothetical protein
VEHRRIPGPWEDPGVSFFEPPPPPPPEPQIPQPAWIGPAENVLGAGVGLGFVLARNEDVGIGVTGFIAEPNGVSFLVDFRRRFGAFPGTDWGRPFPPEHPWPGRDETGFRFGVELSDGRRLTTLDAVHDPGPGPRRPMPPRLIPRGGGGGGQHSYQQGYWLWPLPPPGPLAFVCEWRAAGIALTRVEIDAAPIIAAAARATTLWELPAPDPARPVGWTSY